MVANYDDLLQMTLRENQVTLFDLDGKEQQLDYNRHVHNYVKELAGLRREQRIATVLQLTLDVWASWEIHLEKSSYSLPHYGTVHLEDNWLKSGRGIPPCIILFNQPIVQEDETIEELPEQIRQIRWKSHKVLGPITVRRSVYRADGRQYHAWRIYLSNSVPKRKPPNRAK